MKIARLLSISLLFAAPAFAQGTKTEVKCRPLTPGDNIGPSESIVGSGADTQVCSIVKEKVTSEPTAPRAVTVAPAELVKPAPASPVTVAHDRPVVFLNGAGNTQTTAGRGLFGGAWSNTSQHDQSLELAKDFAGCPVTVTMKQDGADYTVMLNHEANNHNQMAILNASGEVLLMDAAHGIHQSIKNKSEKFCASILADWKTKQGHEAMVAVKASGQ
jgi:hypothetical protein